MCRLWQGFRMAEEVGKSLGGSKILQQKVPRTKRKGHMSSVNLLFPHQLNYEGPFVNAKSTVYIIEEYLFFNQYQFHKQKLAFHRASMKAYVSFLESRAIKVVYIDAQSVTSDIRILIPALAKEGVKSISYIDPTDDYLHQRILRKAGDEGITLIKKESGLFINSRQQIQDYFKAERKKFNQGQFYIQQRKNLDVLMEASGNPMGGKWSFDEENRKKYPKGKEVPKIEFPSSTEFHEEAIEYVDRHYSENPGQLTENPLYAIDFDNAKDWLNSFSKKDFMTLVLMKMQ